MIEPNRVGLLLWKVKRFFHWLWTKVKKVKNWLRSNWKDWLTPAIILITGGFVTWIVDCSQRESAEKIAKSQQKLFALQIFNNRLTGNKIERDLTLDLIKNLDTDYVDKSLINNLIDISNRAIIKLNADSIWGETESGRENAIKEYSTLYYKYPELVMQVIKEKWPDSAHLDSSWALVISISKFFYYLTKDTNSHGKWHGTKDDSIMFANLRNSRFYKYPIEPDSANVPYYLEMGLRNFSIDTTIKN